MLRRYLVTGLCACCGTHFMNISIIWYNMFVSTNVLIWMGLKMWCNWKKHSFSLLLHQCCCKLEQLLVRMWIWYMVQNRKMCIALIEHFLFSQEDSTLRQCDIQICGHARQFCQPTPSPREAPRSPSRLCIFTTSSPSSEAEVSWVGAKSEPLVSGATWATGGLHWPWETKDDASLKISSSKLILSSWKFSCLLTAAPRLRKHRHRRRSGCNLIIFLLLLGPHLL